jgi:hypothetical protein
MTPTELDEALEDMLQDASENVDRMPGLITVQTDAWIDRLSSIGAKCARLDDGLRYRDVVIHIGAQQETKVLARAQAGERGAPFRDLPPRA